MARRPVLQIVHVSDLHFKDTRSSDAKKLNDAWTLLARIIRRIVKRHDLFGWYEGTQGHYPNAPQAFADYIEFDLRPKDTKNEWFASTKNPAPPPTWLVDSGDLTAFGDDHAIKLGKDWLKEWARVLAARDSRSLIGNHDAWVGCHPISAILGLVDLTAAQTRIQKLPDWDRRAWITRPLVADISGTSSKIELYALDSVCWTPGSNLNAVGWVSPESVQNLRNRLTRQGKSAENHFRILAVHHPVAFPWLRKETKALGLFDVMYLLNESTIAEHLNNEASDPDIGPIAHLLLSGHTHTGHPAPPIPHDVTMIKQGTLGDFQLQLVGGALMLNKVVMPPAARPASIRAPETLKDSAFGNSSVESPLCCGHVLRLYYDDEKPMQLKLYRFPILTVSGSKYRQGMAEAITLYIKVARPK
jgi:3',5'-cyclic AMP phosphodiesterase CpdA